MWVVEIVEGYARDLAEMLNRLTAQGYDVRSITPNGINRWVICAYKAVS
jgi:hypothetical protein